MGTRESAVSIKQIIQATIYKEGGYVNDPNDLGGETNWGVTVAVARKHGYTGSMKAMPKAEAVRIYTKEFYLDAGIGRIEPLSPNVAEEVFDTGVNMGVGTAGKFLQRCLNALNLQSKLYPDLVVDGGVGRATASAMESYLKHRGKEGELVLLTLLNSLQGARYVELCEAREKNEAFLYGWARTRVVI
jgi:lysozyme family protein